MKKIIKEIAIFNHDGDKRNIEFKDGLNIITGDSKTGKSALIEIVDYCLFSSRSSIPKGKITDFASLYVLVFQVNDIYIVVGRHSPEFGKISEAYLNIETASENVENIQLDYFKGLALKPIKNDVQTELEQYFGLSFSQLEVGFDRTSKLSIRDAVSFIFQHQNLIANKHAIFYRFDDVNKRKRVIEALPVLLGLVDENYYELKKEKTQVERLIKNEQKLIEKLKSRKKNEAETLRELIQVYYSLIGHTLDANLTILQLRKIGLDLPFPPMVIKDQTKLYTDISNYENERELLYIEKGEIENSLSNLLSNNTDGFEYAKQLVTTYSKQKYNNPDITNACCPLCDSPVLELNEDIKKLETSKEKLVEELSKISNFSKDNTQITNRLKEQKKKIDYRIRIISRNINDLTKNNKEYEGLKEKRDRIIHQKGVVETTIKNILEQNKIGDDNEELKKLQEELKAINLKLVKYAGLKNFKEDTEKVLKEHMDRIAGNLDFEKELKPVDFFFDIDDFSFTHQHKGKIRLDEMGSGANWLACHISIMVAFLHLSCSNNKSVIPNLLFIDQPSQVYFPRTAKINEMDSEDAGVFDDNIRQVRQIFKVLNDEIEIIEKKSGFKPQIIVLEHANDDNFKQFIIKDWDKSKNEGLI
nr:DUF3732 domain-containing protein [uncultured Carboxylicivirga sp.]